MCEPEKKVERLIASQRELYGRIARTYENLRKVGVAKLSVAVVQAAIKVLETKWAKFEAQHDRLVSEFGDECEKTAYVTEDFVTTVETAYLEQVGRLRDFEASLVRQEGRGETKVAKVEGATPRNVLPRIQLPQFSGKFEDWPAFRDLFSSIVIRESALSKVEKIHYLKTSVKGDAEKLIKNLPATEENFERAWTALTEHFENKRLLVRSYLTAYTSLPKMKSDSVADLRRIFHGVVSVVGALEGIGRPISNSTDLFVHIAVELLDAKTRREWENSLGKTSEPPSYDDLREFLQEQLMTQEVLRVAKGEPSGEEKSGRSARANHVRGRGGDSSRSCPLCSKDHFLAGCEQYKRKSAQERREAVTASRRCWNCLGRHMVGECSSSKNCSQCAGRHHSSLHDAFVTVSLADTVEAGSSSVHVSDCPPSGCAPVLLATARVLVTDRDGVRHAVRVLVDPGSESCLISESLAQRLRLPRTPTSVAIYGVGGIRNGYARGRVALTLAARSGQFALPISALVMPRLSVYSGVGEGSISAWPHLKNLHLADPECLSRDPVELLLGADAYASIALPDIRRGGELEPIAQHTRLGWILLGSAGVPRAVLTVSSLQCSTGDDLSEMVRRFWEWEEPPTADLPLSAEDKECEEHFVLTHRRLPCGRYQVRLPLRASVPNLYSTRRAAIRALENAERRFARDAVYRERYTAFMDEYRALGHMSITDAVSAASTARVAYLPHHGVMKGAGPDAKIRVVFNGSSRTAAGDSLNAAQFTGPNLLPSLADVVTRWRRHRFAFVADITKMYRQIQIHPEDRDLQRILWRERGQLVELCLNTVTYGLASAPYLAMRVLRQLAADEQGRFPLGAAVLERDVYMDDVLAGAASMEDCRRLRDQVESLCTAGGFPLSKWAANHGALLDGVSAEGRLPTTGDAALPVDDHAVLGLRWNPGSDDFAPVVRRLAAAAPLTRRVLLSRTARLFDPLGWLAPVVVGAKLLIQSAWLLRLDWDEPLPPEETDAWSGLEEGLCLLEAVRVPRWLRTDMQGSVVELHGFSDASEKAYAAVVYARTIAAGEIHVTLVMAKTKVAPLKRISLPRLELCAASLLVKLAVHVRATLLLETSPLFLWTDSTVTLGWIRGHPARWTTFVANRVAEIQRAAPEARWRHVPGGSNPADCASRGVSPRDLVDHPLWWQGPPFLRDGMTEWPEDLGASIPKDLPEQRPVRSLGAAERREPEELCRFSSLRRLLRVTAWMARWLDARGGHCGSRQVRRGPLDAGELDGALKRWLRAAQAVAFRLELEDIRASRTLSGRSPLRKLAPMVDGEGVLRVGGRIKHSLLSADQKHPIILPEDSHLAFLVIDASHRRTLHGGGQATLADVRQRFWIPRGRQLVRRFIHRCATCVRWRAATPQPMMASLPKTRVVPERPFLHTGVDFAGPILLRTTKGRGHKAYKAFLAVFVCFFSRAVHLEVVSDYSADAFLAAFRRFVSRRGLCRAIYSDCGTNFVGADRQLRMLFRAASRDCHQILGRMADEGVQWHFNPPAAPHFGGLWEAAVKSLKHHMRRVIGETRLTYEEMATFLAEVEACLNSRPLQPLTDDPEDLEALTPGHFLVGAPLTSVPEPTLLDIAANRLGRWQLLQAMRDHLWQRWSREYVQSLNPRPKWWKTRGNVQEGQMCLLKDETTPPSRWPLARIVRLHPGDDGQVRVVDVKTAVGVRTRPVVKVVPLPTDAQ